MSYFAGLSLASRSLLDVGAHTTRVSLHEDETVLSGPSARLCSLDLDGSKGVRALTVAYLACCM